MRTFTRLLLTAVTLALLPVTWGLADRSADAKAAGALHSVPGPYDGQIAKSISRNLQLRHFSRMPFRDSVSSKFLDRYLDSLDNLHMYLTQGDLAEFEKYRTKLDELTTDQGDTSPAHLIFDRFLDRLEQQHDFVNGLLKTETFDFTRDDKYSYNRKEAPRPKDLAEAEQLWRERLRYEYLQEKLNGEKPEEIAKILTRRYARILKALKEYDSEEVLQYYLSSLAHVYDPHSDYLSKSELENFSIGMNLSLFGIGAQLQSEDGYCKIRELVPGGPAMRSQRIKPGDRIIAVAQASKEPVDVVDMKLRKVVDLIRGPKGTEVRLTIIPSDSADPASRKVVSLIREEIKLEDQEAKGKLIETKDSKGQTTRLGVIDLPSFYATFDIEGKGGSETQRSTTADVAKLVRRLIKENVSGIVLDLRRNGGGSLEEAINLTGLFIKKGPVVQVKDVQGRIQIDNDDDDSVLYDGPMVVLTSRFSASASEILAGALQDYDRAVIVGDSSTHGKGTVQSVIQLGQALGIDSNLGALKMTIRKFYRPSGASTQLRGVTPDIVLPSLNNHAELGEASLDNALQWDLIEGSDYEKLHRISPHLMELRTRSDQRVKTDRDFTALREEVERFKKAQAEKSISLNEQQRIAEKEEAKVRREARNKEIKSRPPPDELTYDLNLKTLDLAALTLAKDPSKTAKTGAASTDPSTPKDTSGEKPAAPAKESLPDAEGSTHASADPTVAGEDEDDGLSAIDIPLIEARRILADLIALSEKDRGVAVTQ